MAGKRNPYFDNLKFILISLVVIGHFSSTFLKTGGSEMLYDFKMALSVYHMAAFIFLNGLFAKRLCTAEKGLNIDTVAYYLVLYILFYCLLHLERCTYGHPTFNPFNVVEVPWYLLALVFFSISTAILSKVRLGWKVVIPASLVMSFISGFFVDFGNFLALGRVINFAPFYFAGYYFNTEWLFETVSTLRAKKWPVLIAAGFLIAVIVAIAIAPDKYVTILNKLSKAHYAYEDCGKEPIAVIASMRMLWFALAAAMTICTCILTPIGKTFFTKAGTKTLQVYIFHAFVYYALNGFGLMKKFTALSLPFDGLWLVLFALLVTWLLALPDFPMKFFRFLRQHIRLGTT